MVWGSLGVALFTAIYPAVRVFYRVEITYNEGWNVYNASAVAQHQMLYPAGYGWTTVNYPMLSFVIAAWMHRFTHDYLLTARILSLFATLGCGVLAGCIVRKVTGSVRAGWIAGAYCIAIFCAAADFYVGQDDPAMLALAVFMAALLLYVSRRESLSALVGVAAIFAVAVNIKHDPIGFLLAVGLDLLLLSWRRALWFCAWEAAFLAVGVWLNLHFGGPGFLTQLSAPRTFSSMKGLEQVGVVFGPLLLPFAAAVYAAWTGFGNDKTRVLSLLLVIGLVLGVAFGGGTGVSVNAQFSAMLGVAMLSGVALERVTSGEWRWAGPRVRALAAPAMLVWLVVPLIVCDTWNPVRRLRETVADQRHFEEDVAFLRSQGGPALCESLLRCYFAGKPYVYDPFNATRLIAFHKLDDAVIVDGLSQHRYGAVQLDAPRQDDDALPDRFNAKIAAAIEQNYKPVLEHDGASVYLPR